MRIRLVRSLLLANLLCLLLSSAALAAPPSDVYFDVGVRGTGSATIHANVYTNPRDRGVTTILAVHGFTEVGSMFEPLANAIFADAALGLTVKRIVSIDLPGHGESSVPSGLPNGLKFGDLLIEDNVDVVIQSIDALRAKGLGAQVIMGHSMGGLAVQATQEFLLAHGSSLAKHGILGAVLISAVPARGSVWTQLVSPDLTPFVKSDAVLGTYIDVPAVLGPQTAGFLTLAGTPVPNAPPASVFVANGWSGIEPINTGLELIGTAAPLWRPTVRQGAFALRNGTILTVISASQDLLTPAVDQDDLYTYLTGLKAGQLSLYRPVVAADACHSMYVSNPSGLLQALRSGVF